LTSYPDKSIATKILKNDSAVGILLVAGAVAGLLFANTELKVYYNLLIDLPVEIRIGKFEISKPLLLWINDGFMAVFFLLIGLELKREFLEGELSDRRKIILPALGAIGGMVVPAAIYIYINWNSSKGLQGWAIPAATDIAFALGILSLLGSRVPASLKIFLVSLAIFDDIGAIMIIAFFYTGNISILALVVAGICILMLYLLNKSSVDEISSYIFIGIIMWIAFLKSGVHATLTGVILAMFIPMKSHIDQTRSPLKSLEKDLTPAVYLIILPLFAFANTGIDLAGTGKEQIIHSIPLGIAIGLFAGKQIGIFMFCWVGIILQLAELPGKVSWLSLYGVSVLCGIGFTMSLFISSLAFEGTGLNVMFDERIGILIGSVASAILGYLVLRYSLGKD